MAQTAAATVDTHLRQPEVQNRIATALSMLRETRTRIEAVQAPGYVPYFERLGFSGFEARTHAALIFHFTKKIHADHQNRRVALSALHDLAKRPRWHPALARQAGMLRDHCGNADFLDDAFHKAGCPELSSEFLHLLQHIGDGDDLIGARLIEILSRIAAYAPSPRGRPIQVETVLHQTFLHLSAHVGGRYGYTFGLVPDSDNDREDFLDEATKATRIELRRPSFNPVAARRAERKRLARNSRIKANS